MAMVNRGRGTCSCLPQPASENASGGSDRYGVPGIEIGTASPGLSFVLVERHIKRAPARLLWIDAPNRRMPVFLCFRSSTSHLSLARLRTWVAAHPICL